MPPSSSSPGSQGSLALALNPHSPGEPERPGPAPLPSHVPPLPTPGNTGFFLPYIVSCATSALFCGHLPVLQGLVLVLPHQAFQTIATSPIMLLWYTQQDRWRGGSKPSISDPRRYLLVTSTFPFPCEERGVEDKTRKSPLLLPFRQV